MLEQENPFTDLRQLFSSSLVLDAASKKGNRRLKNRIRINIIAITENLLHRINSLNENEAKEELIRSLLFFSTIFQKAERAEVELATLKEIILYVKKLLRKQIEKVLYEENKVYYLTNDIRSRLLDLNSTLFKQFQKGKPIFWSGSKTELAVLIKALTISKKIHDSTGKPIKDKILRDELCSLFNIDIAHYDNLISHAFISYDNKENDFNFLERLNAALIEKYQK